MPGPLPTPAPRGLPSGMDKQASAELEAGSSKKIQSMLWGKGGSRSSNPGAPPPPAAAAAAAATPAAAGALPRATPSKKKAIQEKKSLGGGSKVSLGRAFPSWGQRLKAAPLEPATFPPISGVPLLGRSKRYSLLPLGPKQSKHSGIGKRSMAKKTRESQPVAREDNDPNRDADPQAQLPTQRPGSPGLGMHLGEFGSGDPSTNNPQSSGSSQLLDLSPGDLTPRGPATSGESYGFDSRGDGCGRKNWLCHLLPGFPAFQQNKAFPVGSCSATWLLPGAGCDCSSASVQPRATVLRGPQWQLGLTLGSREVRPKERGGAVGQSRCNLLPHFRPSRALSTSHLGWGAGFCVLFQVTRNQPFVTHFQKGSSNHLEHRAVPGVWCYRKKEMTSKSN
uniref:uncharacterized protein CXorf49 homolog isoform X1 n=1 Tax=Ictidomys tridecemlineatus TaxID=43179 RepID=UPI001A9EE06E|nr:uncharacterized protein CXorf49 homolog isoform X1 [Ictidomys tridecemlineatus]